jgi:3-oxoacyl-[acyl-carrier-protein] synthase II
MSEVFLLDGAAETALASWDGGLFAALAANKGGFGPVTRFDASKLTARSAACLEPVPGERRETENLTQTLLRRILPKFAPLPDIETIVWAGVKGNAEFVEAGAFQSDPPCPFPFLPRDYSLWVRDELGHPKAGLVEVSAACASSTLGLAVGADLISSGMSCSVLVVAADIVSRFSFLGFNALNALSPGACRPFDKDRDGLLLGDGAAAVLLADGDYVRLAERRPLARLSGWGVANDATHITAPARDGRGLIAAIDSALKRARLEPRGIGAFSAHGTGTVYNDAMELTALDAVFGDRPFPVFSIKGAVGHTLGAAGGIEALVSARALVEGLVPPTLGLEHPEPKAHGRVSGEAQKFSSKRIMKTNSGFGGVNVALILEEPERTDG